MLAALRTHEDAEERSPEAEATPKIIVLAAMLSCIADGCVDASWSYGESFTTYDSQVHYLTVMSLVDSIP
jgi:hypothetical protein